MEWLSMEDNEPPGDVVLVVVDEYSPDIYAFAILHYDDAAEKVNITYTSMAELPVDFEPTHYIEIPPLMITHGEME